MVCVVFKLYFFFSQIIKGMSSQLPWLLTGFRENHKTSKLLLQIYLKCVKRSLTNKQNIGAISHDLSKTSTLKFVSSYLQKRCESTKTYSRSNRPEVFLGESVLKICSKFTEEHPCRSAISIKLQSNFIEITLSHGCSPVNLLHNFTSEGYSCLMVKCTPYYCWKRNAIVYNLINIFRIYLS